MPESVTPLFTILDFILSPIFLIPWFIAVLIVSFMVGLYWALRNDPRQGPWCPQCHMLLLDDNHRCSKN